MVAAPLIQRIIDSIYTGDLTYDAVGGHSILADNYKVSTTLTLLCLTGASHSAYSDNRCKHTTYAIDLCWTTTCYAFRAFERCARYAYQMIFLAEAEFVYRLEFATFGALAVLFICACRCASCMLKISR